MSPRTSNGLPVTAYLVLGVLAANDEQLTAGEIKMRAELSVGHFYWSPSVSHVRRELARLLARGMVSETGAQSGKRAITLYETTEAGLDAMRRWVQHFGQDQVVIKHPVILKTWLARGEIPNTSWTPWIAISTRPGPGSTRRCGRGSVPRARHHRGSGTAVLLRGSGLRDPGSVRGDLQHLPVARRDRRRHQPRSGQTGATVEGADPPPGTAEPGLTV